MARESKGRHARSAQPARPAGGHVAAAPSTGSARRRPRVVRAPAARHFRVGELRADGAGTVLRCLVLVPGPDWVAVDLDSGAFLRAPTSFGGLEGTARAEQMEPGAPEGVETPTPEWPERQLSAVALTLASDSDPPDPARPEAVALAGQPVLIGQLRRRTTRRLLRQLVTKTNDRPLLGTLGPSISYGDLDGTRPSVAIVAPQAQPRFGIGPNGPWCQFALAGRRHTMPCSEGAAPDASATGHDTKLLVVALGAPRRGQVPKIVLGALPLKR